MAKITSLHDLFLHELADLYDAEHQILEALPRMVEAVTHKELKKALKDHLHQTEEQVNRLEEVYELLEEEAERQTCDGMKGLLKEGDKMLAAKIDPSVLDAAIISAAQRVEHYEIAGYGVLIAWARLLEHEEVADLLQETLDEEKDADQLLTDIAERVVNVEAPDEMVEEEEEEDEEEEEQEQAEGNDD